MADRSLTLKNYRSSFLSIIAIFYMAFPVLILLLSGFFFEVPLERFFSILLSPSFYFVSIWSIAAGIGLWQMFQWGWYVFVFSNLMIIYFNAWIMANYAQSEHKGLIFAISIFSIVLFMWRIRREVKVPYFLPKIKWWESDPGQKLNISGLVTRSDGTQVSGHILDLALSGCFFKIQSDLEQDEVLTVYFNTGEHQVQCQGHVVWRAKSTVTHPKGIGIKFTQFEKQSRKSLKLLVSAIQNKTLDSRS